VSGLAGRVERWASQRPARVAGRNPWMTAVQVLTQSIEDRVGGLAAEMAFFALLSLLPLLIAVGAALGYLELLVGAETIDRSIEQALDGARAVFGQPFTRDSIRPLLVGLLTRQRGGTAITGLVGAVYLSSRVFTATIRALDIAYDLDEHRSLLAQRALAIAFSLGAVVVVPVTLAGLVVGPLLGSGQELAASLGLSDAFAVVWSIGRWPALFLLVVFFFTTLYRFGPNARLGWTESVPGALLGVVLWIVASLGFRVYLAAGGGTTGVGDGAEEAVQQIAQVVGAVVAAILWIYLTSVVVLVGGELNAVLAREGPAPPPTSA